MEGLLSTGPTRLVSNIVKVLKIFKDFLMKTIFLLRWDKGQPPLAERGRTSTADITNTPKIHPAFSDELRRTWIDRIDWIDWIYWVDCADYIDWMEWID